MEFTTRISEQDFLAGHRLAQKSAFNTVLTVWMYLLLAWLVFQLAYDLLMGPKVRYVLFDGLSVLVLIGFWWMFLPNRLRRRYRKDPSQHGENLVRIGPEGLSEESSSGTRSSRAWSLCSHWSESGRVFVLKSQSGIFYIFPKACLSAGQQEELRSTLSAVLPKKW
jgi:hypothetical protein